MKTPFTILCYFSFLYGALANYLIDGPVSVLAIETAGKMILVPGEIDGVSGYFMLDTGAPELILNERLFPDRQLGRKRILQDVGKKMICRQVRVRHFIMGNIYRDDFQLIAADLSATELALDREILGLLGHDVLKNFETRIDYYGGFITFCALDAEGQPVSRWHTKTSDHQIEFVMEGHLPVIRGQLMGKEKLRFGLDSGASINLMDQIYQGFLRRNCIDERAIDFQCINTTVEDAPFFILPMLEVEDDYQVQFWRTSVGDFSHFRANDMYIHAILGANFFQLGELSINYQLQRIEIWDEPGRLNRRYSCVGH